MREFTVEKPGARERTLIQPRPLTPTVRTRQCGHTVWGIKRLYIYIYLIILYMKLDHKCVQSLSIAPGRAGVEVSEKRATVKNHALKEYDVRFT